MSDLTKKIEVGLEFTDALSKFFDGSLPVLFDEVSREDDLDLYNDDENLLTFTDTDVIVSEKKMKAKIAEVILENRINDMLFEMEYSKSVSKEVFGYG
jgi:hypothetical protein